MSHTLRFVLVLHNHQPVGNFDGVMEQAYQDSYLPFLDVFETYPSLRIGLHTSGSLMEWLDAAHPEYVDRLAGLVAMGRIEIVGGPYYEPIMTMIPPRDRIGQIRRYTAWLEERLGAKVQGMWMPERVWEQSLTSDVVEAGMRYTMLDDRHFKNAGLADDELHGYYVTEDDGRVLSIFPGSEQMRYLIPFADPHATINALREIADKQPGATVMFADDGEKFGTWPDTKKHVYADGWLRRFFDLLCENQHWIKVTTPSEAIENTPPIGKIYLPEGSYREMTEWVLPAELQVNFEHLTHDLKSDPRWPLISQFLRGGYWRNFKNKYPETNEMYSRMLLVSRRLQELVEGGASGDALDQARQELYRGQCNCSYWHGAFGGIYLPHLRNAIYTHLIAADTLLDEVVGREENWVEITATDLNFDARPEVQLASDKLVAFLAPAQGGLLYELDIRSINLNLLATLSRRREAYHQKVLAGAQEHTDSTASIHDRVVFKQPGLEKKLQYDAYLRKSLVDHFYDLNVSREDIVSGNATELGDFVGAPFEAKLRRGAQRVQVQLSRQGKVADCEIQITKGVTMEAGSNELSIAYLLEGVPAGAKFHFAVEMNFAAMPAGADDRYFYNGERQRLGQLGEELDLHEVTSLGLVDQWLGLDAQLQLSRPSGIWTYPIAAVSQSEGGFELVHQSVVVIPHWIVEADANGTWSMTLDLTLDTQMAESRMRQNATTAVH